MPGVAITITPAEGGAALATSSQLDGTFSQEIPGPGRYQVKGELAAFAPVTQEIIVGADCQARLELALTLASRTPGAAPVQAQPIPAQRLAAAGQFQRLAPVADAAGVPQQQQTGAAAGATEDQQTIIAHLSLPPGFSPE
ncbi:MAG: carboxypeptidase regulatory-like domain-containing protein, partial [Planctomycetes bacterium]|nr:carboxypeptidase regulatory-like domain-containing protein [Planctomycetota bacterium]